MGWGVSPCPRNSVGRPPSRSYSPDKLELSQKTSLRRVSVPSSPPTATLKSRRSLSFKLRRTCRLSFSDCASGMCSSRVSRPTGMSGSGGQPGGLFLTGGPAALSGGFRGAHLGNAEAFQDIADLHIVEIGHARAALKTSADS